MDSAGNIFVADTFQSLVRKVDPVSLEVTTVAGNGVNAYQGDGGLATAAGLTAPTGLAFDDSSNLYIAAAGNNVIRKVDGVSGIITTVAGTGRPKYIGDGGPATGAALRLPTGVAVGSNGALYIADNGNNTIRKVDPVTGIITTVAGTSGYGFSGDGGASTAAWLAHPSGVVVNSTGNLFITDTENNRIRMVGPTALPISVADPPAGEYFADARITLKSNVTATIFYTTDGSTPTTSSPEYAGPIDISATTTLKFFLISDNLQPL